MNDNTTIWFWDDIPCLRIHALRIIGGGELLLFDVFAVSGDPGGYTSSMSPDVTN